MNLSNPHSVRARQVASLIVLSKRVATSGAKIVKVPIPDSGLGGSKGSQHGLEGRLRTGDTAETPGGGGRGRSEARSAER